MKNVLKIDANIFEENQASAHLSNTFISALQAQGEINLTTRNVSQGNIPHFNADTIASINAGQATLADTLIKEVQDADILILSVPMCLFGLPSELKAWFDHIARPQVTFISTANGPVGLLENKKVYIITNHHSDQYKNTADVEIPFLSTMLGLIGLDDIEYIYADNQAITNRHKLTQVEQHIHQIIDTSEAA